LWPHLWRPKTGPDWGSERALALDRFDCWVQESKDSERLHSEAIITHITRNQEVFAGIGRWQGADLLHDAHIHPLMPAAYVALSPELSAALRSSMEHMSNKLNPLCSTWLEAHPAGKGSWRLTAPPKGEEYSFNENAHNTWKSAVVVYQRAFVNFGSNAKMSSMPPGYLDPAYKLQDSGIAVRIRESPLFNSQLY
jgi:hypothetical protein